MAKIPIISFLLGGRFSSQLKRLITKTPSHKEVYMTSTTQCVGPKIKSRFTQATRIIKYPT